MNKIKFIFSAVEALRLCKTFYCDPSHALSYPSSFTVSASVFWGHLCHGRTEKKYRHFFHENQFTIVKFHKYSHFFYF